MDIKALVELSVSDIKNDIALPIWIYKVENIKVNEKRYLKIYLMNRLFNNAEVKQITFKHHDKECTANKFSVVSTYNDKNIFGVAIGVDPSDETTDLAITKVYLGKEVYEASNELVTYQMASTEGKDMDYFKMKFRNLKVFPKVEDKYYQCACGRINNLDQKCHCGKTIDYAKQIINFNVKEDKINTYANRDITYDLEKTFEENVDKYCDGFIKTTGLSADEIKARIDLAKEEEKYNLLVKNAQEAKEKALIQEAKNKKAFKLIGIVAAVIAVLVVGINIFAKDYVTYFKCGYKHTNTEKYVCYGELDVMDAKDKANEAFKAELVERYSNLDYEGVLALLANDSMYSTAVETNNYQPSLYEFNDEQIQDIYVDTVYQIMLQNDHDYNHVLESKKILEHYGNAFVEEFDAYEYEHNVSLIETGDLEVARYFHHEYNDPNSAHYGEGNTLVNMQKTLHFYLVNEYTRMEWALNPSDYNAVLSEFGYENVKDLYYTLKEGGYSSKFVEHHCYDQVRLLGYWYNGDEYFTLFENEFGGTRCEFNIPWFDGDTYIIHDGIYYTYFASNEANKTKQYKFSFLDDDGIKVYCYKDGSYHYLYK